LICCSELASQLVETDENEVNSLEIKFILESCHLQPRQRFGKDAMFVIPGTQLPRQRFGNDAMFVIFDTPSPLTIRATMWEQCEVCDFWHTVTVNNLGNNLGVIF
jgi:hypothetical protein